MGVFVPVSGPILADTVYCNNRLVARDVAFTLPEVTPLTVDLPAMGTLSVPIWQLLENMEATITKVGVDKGLLALIKPNMKPLEFRWVQTVTDSNGNTKNVGCKAFLRGMSTKIPGIGGEVGTPSENEVTLSVTRYSMFADGEELWLIDRFASICRIGGVDYAGDISSML